MAPVGLEAPLTRPLPTSCNSRHRLDGKSLEVYKRLLQRFPHVDADEVALALRDAAGHAGRAAAALRAAFGEACASAELFSTPTCSAADHTRDERPAAACTPEMPTPADVVFAEARSELRASPGVQDAGTPRRRADRRSSPDLLAALETEGQRLRRELDAALAEVGAARRPSAAAATFEVQSPREWRSSAALSPQLARAVRASVDEGRQLRRELEDALQAGSLRAGLESAERDRLRQELDRTLKMGAGRATSPRIAEAENERTRLLNKASLLKAEVDAMTWSARPAGRTHCSFPSYSSPAHC
eukprot:TRINITY_DN43963_c0_g3_i1.p1 TRINITY_DN43963_c0_g3~~TRINITY_DN43963_c0_g3_i1.p1  ORF type:complete len:302 (+),score=49.73 TRINITY_DN43963_c0_g3_i1:61-966(+)